MSSCRVSKTGKIWMAAAPPKLKSTRANGKCQKLWGDHRGSKLWHYACSRMGNPQLAQRLHDARNSLLEMKKCRPQRGHALRAQLKTGSATKMELRVKKVGINSYSRRGTTTAARGNQAYGNRQPASRRLRRSWRSPDRVCLSDWVGTRGSPPFQPTNAHANPITSAGNIISERVTSPPITLAAPKVTNATLTQCGRTWLHFMLASMSTCPCLSPFASRTPPGRGTRERRSPFCRRR